MHFPLVKKEFPKISFPIKGLISLISFPLNSFFNKFFPSSISGENFGIKPLLFNFTINPTKIL